MLLTDDELDQVTGRVFNIPSKASDEKDIKVGFEHNDRNGENPFFYITKIISFGYCFIDNSNNC